MEKGIQKRCKKLLQYHRCVALRKEYLGPAACHHHLKLFDLIKSRQVAPIHPSEIEQLYYCMPSFQ